MNTQHIAALTALTATLLLVGCSDTADHALVTPVAATIADQPDAGGEKITHFGDKTELFVEFPTLIVGQAVSFVAHLTQLSDFKPLTQGKLTVVLSGGDAADERFAVDAPSVPGIFKPSVTPKAAGAREMTLIVDSAQGVLTHALGPVTVFADAKAAQSGRGNRVHDDDTGIPFSKEQQWKIDFATAAAIRGVVRPSITATATIRAHPDGEAQLVAPAAGLLRVAGSFPRVGQRVKKGQVLAWLAPRLGGDTDQATLEAGAGKARIALEQAKRERERMETLFKDEAIAEKRLFEAHTNERLAQVEATAAQARAGQFGGSGGSGGVAIRAPLDGMIVDVSVTAGAFVAEGAPLFHVANTGRLWLEARVPESEIGRLGTPAAAAFSVDGFERAFAIEPGNSGNSGGRLIAVGGVVDAATRTVPVIFEFNNPGGILRLGMTAKAQLFAGNAQEAVVVPASAVQDESGTQVVYVLTGGESFARRLVKTGPRDGDRIAIVAGLEPGQRVVSKGAYLIRLSTSKAGPSGHGH